LTPREERPAPHRFVRPTEKKRRKKGTTLAPSERINLLKRERGRRESGWCHHLSSAKSGEKLLPKNLNAYNNCWGEEGKELPDYSPIDEKGRDYPTPPLSS